MPSSKRVLLLSVLFGVSPLWVSAHGQLVLTAEYDRLRRYEGTYEDAGGGTLQIAASPRDGGRLVAILDGAKYPLEAAGGDEFVDATGRHVQFSLEKGHEGYRPLTGIDAGRLFRKTAPGAPLDERIWYPRPHWNAGYRYAPPAALEDGLPVGSMIGTPLDPARMQAMGEALASEAYPDVHGILVAYRGRLVFEEYFYEFDAATPHPLRSATKSIVSALVGLTLAQGRLKDVHQPVFPFFADEYPRIANMTDVKQRITVEDLLTMRSGLDCDDWNQDSPGNESKMGRSDDWVKFVLDLPMRGKPGVDSSYCSGNVIVLGRLVEKLTGEPLVAFGREHLFAPLGFRRFEWRFAPDRSSVNTFCQISLTPRDMVKLGLLYLNGGTWNGGQVLPRGWVEASTARHTAVGDMEYGYLWWRPFLEVPGGRHAGVMATGNGGQKIYIWPALDLVVVMTGGNYNRSSKANELAIEYILPAVGGAR